MTDRDDPPRRTARRSTSRTGAAQTGSDQRDAAATPADQSSSPATRSAAADAARSARADTPPAGGLSGGESSYDRPAVGQRRGEWSAPLLLAIVALVVGILVGGFTAYYEYTRPAMYESQVVLLIDQPGVISATGDVGVIDKLSQLRLKYAGIVRTEVFSGPVADKTGLPEPAVRGSLSDVVDPSSLLFSIASTTRDPQASHAIAQAAGDELTAYVQNEQEQVNVPPRLQVQFSVVTPASPAVRVAPNRHRAELVGLLVFLAITIAGLLAADLLRRRRRG